MITTLAYISLLVGIICVVLGYTVEPRALRPGWGLVILGIVLILIAYVMPLGATHAAGLLTHL